MKNIRLLFIIATLYACTPNAVNTLPSPSKVSPTNSKPVTSSSNTSTSTASPSVIPNIPLSTPSSIVAQYPSPSSLGEFDNMKIYSDTGLIMTRLANTSSGVYEYKKYIYNALKHESLKFDAEYIDKNGTISKDIIWSVSDENVASITQDGLLTTKQNTGLFSVIATYKKDTTKTLFFQVNVYDSLEYLVCDGEVARNRSRFVLLPEGEFNGEIKERITFSGKVYNPYGELVEGATVNAQSVVPGVNWTGETQVTVGGEYVFRNAPLGAKVAITVSKDGWTSRTRSGVLKSNLTGDPCDNIFNFGYKSTKDYAIQDEPEIIQLKINEQQVLSSSNQDEFIIDKNVPKNIKPIASQLAFNNQIIGVGNVPSLAGVNSNNLEIEMTFSEPPRTDDVRNYFRITSQSGFNNRATSFTIDENYSGVDFTVSPDERTITFKTNKAILANKEGQESRYLIDFSQAFRDKTDKSAIDRRYFRFSPTQINDFAVFSIKNDEKEPKLLGITARDGGSANDTIELRYSEPMELINQVSYPAGLSDPNAPTNLSRQLWYRDANSVMANVTSISNNISDNNATLVGYLSNSDTDSNQFRASYMIGKILASDYNNGTQKMSILGKKDRVPNLTPVKGNTVTNDLLRNARITGSNVLLEFSPTAFDKGDIIVLSVGGRITGSSVNRNITPSSNEDQAVNTLSNVEYASISDPSGRLIDLSRNVLAVASMMDTHNSQKATIAQ